MTALLVTEGAQMDDNRLAILEAFAQRVQRLGDIGPSPHNSTEAAVYSGRNAGKLDYLRIEATRVRAEVAAIEVAMDEAQMAERDRQAAEREVGQACNDCGGVDEPIVTDSGYCQRCADGPTDEQVQDNRDSIAAFYSRYGHDRSFGAIPR